MLVGKNPVEVYASAGSDHIVREWVPILLCTLVNALNGDIRIVNVDPKGTGVKQVRGPAPLIQILAHGNTEPGIGPGFKKLIEVLGKSEPFGVPLNVLT